MKGSDLEIDANKISSWSALPPLFSSVSTRSSRLSARCKDVLSCTCGDFDGGLAYRCIMQRAVLIVVGSSLWFVPS